MKEREGNYVCKMFSSSALLLHKMHMEGTKQTEITRGSILPKELRFSSNELRETIEDICKEEYWDHNGILDSFKW